MANEDCRYLTQLFEAVSFSGTIEYWTFLHAEGT
jgi:hypothetical protein